MNEKKFAVKIKRYAVLGISLLGLAAIGCGGGSGTLQGVPQECIGAARLANEASCTERGFSLQKVGSVNKALGTLGNSATLQIYTLDGDLLDTIPNFKLPSPLKISGELYSKASAQGGLVYRLTNDDGLDYTTVSALDAASLSSNGPIKNNDGTLKQEPVNAGSTVRTALLEAELSQQTGKAVRLGTVASADVKAALKTVVSEVAVDQIAGALKDAEFTDGSLIKSIADTVTSSGSAGAVNSQDAIRKYLSTGKDANGANNATDAVKTQLKQARRLAKAATRLSKQAKKNASNKAKVKSLLADLTSSTEAQANNKAAGAEVINAALDLATKVDSLESAANDLFALTDLTQVAAEAETKFLNKIDDQVALELASKGAVSEVANLLGNVVAQTSSLSTTAQAALNKVQSNLSDSDKNKLAGGLLAATVDNVEAAKTVIANAGVSVTEALKAVANEVNVADVVGVIEDVINTSEGLTSLTTADLVNSLREVVDGDVLSSIVAEVNLAIADAACIGGFPCGEDNDASRSASLTAKKNDLITLKNASYENDDAATYKYSWSIPTSVGTGAKTTSEQAVFTVTNSGSVVLEQSKNGTKVSTFTLAITVQEKLSPVISLSATELRVKPARTAQMTVKVNDPEGRTIASTVSVQKIGGGAVTGLTIKKSGDSLTLEATAAAVPSDTPYQGKIMVKEGDTLLASAVFDVYIDNYAATKLSVGGVADVTTGTPSVLTLTAFSENPEASGIMTLTVKNAISEDTVKTVTAAVTYGKVTTSVSVANDAAGLFEVTGEATGATTQTLIYSVREKGAPEFTSVKFNGSTVKQGDSITRVISGEYLTVDIDAVASIASGSIATYTVMGILDGSVFNLGSTTGIDIQTSIGAGNWVFIVSAESDQKTTVSLAFEVKVNVQRTLTVTSVALSGVTTNTLTTSIEGGQYKVNASAVQGLSLGNEGLTFTVYTDGLDPVINGHDYDITVKLITPSADLREASIAVSGATIVAGQTGYDVTAASSITFKGKKADGIQEAVFTAPSSAINNFAHLFTEAGKGITIDINALKMAVKEDVISSAGSFYQSIDTLTGTGLKLEVTVTAPNFSFNTGGKSFNTFVIENITVE